MYKGLRMFRKAKDITCFEMAAILGLSKSSYCKKEKGIVKFSLTEAKTVADYLGCSIDYIFFESECW